MFSQLRDLWLDDYAAIGLPRILCIVVLVIVFRSVEVTIRNNLSDNWLLPHPLIVELLNHLTSNLLLFRIVVEHRRAILCPHVRSLAVVRRWVMSCKEDLQKIPERYDTGVECYLDRFSVPRVSGANLLIGRIRNVSARIARFHLHDTFQLVEDGFCAPETASCKRGHF